MLPVGAKIINPTINITTQVLVNFNFELGIIPYVSRIPMQRITAIKPKIIDQTTCPIHHKLIVQILKTPKINPTIPPMMIRISAGLNFPIKSHFKVILRNILVIHFKKSRIRVLT